MKTTTKWVIRNLITGNFLSHWDRKTKYTSWSEKLKKAFLFDSEQELEVAARALQLVKGKPAQWNHGKFSVIKCGKNGRLGMVNEVLPLFRKNENLVEDDENEADLDRKPIQLAHPDDDQMSFEGMLLALVKGVKKAFEDMDLEMEYDQTYSEWLESIVPGISSWMNKRFDEEQLERYGRIMAALEKLTDEERELLKLDMSDLTGPGTRGAELRKAFTAKDIKPLPPKIKAKLKKAIKKFDIKARLRKATKDVDESTFP